MSKWIILNMRARLVQLSSSIYGEIPKLCLNGTKRSQNGRKGHLKLAVLSGHITADWHLCCEKPETVDKMD